jgi:hypothetical protein
VLQVQVEHTVTSLREECQGLREALERQKTELEVYYAGGGGLLRGRGGGGGGAGEMEPELSYARI